jgi:hypothetical protein
MRLGDKITSWVLNFVKMPEIIKYHLYITGKNNIDNVTIILRIGK